VSQNTNGTTSVLLWCLEKASKVALPTMHIRCERCRAEYDLDDGQIRGGTDVQCSVCGNVFAVGARRTPTLSDPAPFIATGHGRLGPERRLSGQRRALPFSWWGSLGSSFARARRAEDLRRSDGGGRGGLRWHPVAAGPHPQRNHRSENFRRPLGLDQPPRGPSARGATGRKRWSHRHSGTQRKSDA
jgi:predicted Zn finger-like uncharacterized protein